MFGIDYAWGRPRMTSLHNSGVKFVCRYLAGGSGGGKELTHSEASQLSAAGISIVVVWETSAERALSGHAAGVTDAQRALSQARACGMTGNRPIYFACDWDVTSAQQATVNAYLDGAASVLGRNRVGIYGGYWPVSRAMRAGHATWGWQTYAWSAGQWWTGAQLQQYSNGHVIDGVSVDYDRSTATDFGGWHVGAVPSPPPADWIHQLMSAFPTLKLGDNGEDVRTVQALLNVRATDTDKAITVDGAFGAATETRVKEEQQDYKITADGIVGDKTLSVLLVRKVV